MTADAEFLEKIARQQAALARHDETWDWGGILVRQWTLNHLSRTANILDVGAGRGKYRDLLLEFENMDACEVWEETVDAEDLRGRYRNVFVQDVADLDFLHDYDLVILGDVLEHLTREAAKAVLSDCRLALVVTPFLYPQGEENGNPYQEHIQADLTPELVAELYPDLLPLSTEWRNRKPFKGLYLLEEK